MDMTGWTPEGGIDDRVRMPPWPLPNVWVGTSIENDEYTWRADELRRAPAAIRFLSLEPLLGPLPSLDLAGIDWVIVGGKAAPISGRWTWAGWVTCGTAASACRFRCSSNRSAGSRPRQAGAC